ncbi:hypothetical protein HY947_01915 [Candidatus Gottesmanbacteria bacterium]|nr:hypothetical protein [Candidatus Gottesmanbacteria bacterium]
MNSELKNQIKGYLVWFGLSLVASIINVYVAIMAAPIGPDSETAFNTLGSLVGGLFIFLYSLLAANSAIKWNDAQKLCDEIKRVEFMLILKKRIPVPLWIMLGLLSLSIVIMFHFFHFQYTITLVVVHGILAFVIAFSLQALWDIDDPEGGVFNVKIPKNWKED